MPPGGNGGRPHECVRGRACACVRATHSAPNAARRQWIFADLRFQRQKGESNAKKFFFNAKRLKLNAKRAFQRQKAAADFLSMNQHGLVGMCVLIHTVQNKLTHMQNIFNLQK